MVVYRFKSLRLWANNKGPTHCYCPSREIPRKHGCWSYSWPQLPTHASSESYLDAICMCSQLVTALVSSLLRNTQYRGPSYQQGSICWSDGKYARGGGAAGAAGAGAGRGGGRAGGGGAGY